jgi:biopolymer transport protein ExbD
MVKIRKMIQMTSEISMASMSDIAFLLIIFFMVASVFIIKDGLHLVLPDKQRKPVIIASKSVITIAMYDDGTITYDEKEIARNKIEEKLQSAFSENEKIFVLLRVSKKVKYRDTVTVIDMVKFAGIKRLSIKMM